MSIETYIRRCPACNLKLKYSYRQGFDIAKKLNSLCNQCAAKERNNRPELRAKASKRMMGENNPMKRPEVRAKNSKNHIDVSGKKNPNYGNIGKNAPIYGYKHTKEELQKMRESALKRHTPSFNPIACKIIDEYGKKHGYKFQHATNGGEFKVIGYSVDGYDAKKNVVIEYYENRHKRRWRKDLVRQRRIIKVLNCKFIILREWEI